MGVCASKVRGELEESKEGFSQKSFTLDSRDLSVRFRALSFDSLGSSAEVGDIGRLGTLLCRSAGSSGGFSKSHQEIIRRRSPGSSAGDISFTPYLSSPLARELDTHGFDAIAKSYAESAARAAAQDTFMFLKENDRALATSSARLISSSHRLLTFSVLDGSLMDCTEDEEDTSDGIAEDEELGAAGYEFLHSSPPGAADAAAENEVEETERATDNSSQPAQTDPVIFLGAPFKERVTPPPSPPPSVEQRSHFEACFPATSRWASVVNAARQSACLPARPLRLANQGTDKRREAAAAAAAARDGDEQEFCCPTVESPDSSAGSQQQRRSILEIRSGTPQNPAAAAAVVVSPSIIRDFLGCCGQEREAIAEEAECSSSIRIESGSRAQHQNPGGGNSTTDGVPDSTIVENFEGQGCLACFSLANGLRIHLPTMKERNDSSCSIIALCSNSGQDRITCQGSDQPDDPDADAFFSFPSSPSAAATHHHEVIGSRKNSELVECFEDQLRSRSSEQARVMTNALPSKGAFGSPFPVCGANSRKAQHRLEKKLQGFSLEFEACADALACNSVASDSVASTTEPDSPETSSSNHDFGRDVHDTDDSSSDLFEIGNIHGTSIMGFTGLDFPCLPIKKNFTTKDVSEISSGCMSASPGNPGSVRNLMRGAKAVRTANSRAKVLKEQAKEKAKSAELVKEMISGETAKNGQHGKGLVLMNLGLSQRKHLVVKNTTTTTTENCSQGNNNGILQQPVDSQNRPAYFATTQNETMPATSSTMIFTNDYSIKGFKASQALDRLGQQHSLQEVSATHH